MRAAPFDGLLDAIGSRSGTVRDGWVAVRDRLAAVRDRLAAFRSRWIVVRDQWTTVRDRLTAVSDRSPVWYVLRELAFLARFLLFVLVARLTRHRGRDPDLWVFGASGGTAFADNGKYLFLHVAANEPSIRPVWTSKNRAVVALLRRNGYEAYHAYSPRGIALTCRAGVVLLTQGLRDVNMACAGGATIVQLWHGIALKRIGWDAERGDTPWPIRWAHRYLSGQISQVHVPSHTVSDTFASGLGVERDRIVVTGYPRNDALVRDVPGATLGVDEASLRRLERCAAAGRVVLFLPTWREFGGRLVDHLDLASLDDLLAAQNAHCFVKPHPMEPFDVDDGAYERIWTIPPSSEPYPLLRYADVLLTDYSSVYFDFLALDRPIVFYPYDLDAYRSRRGFYFAYDEVTPGPTARTFPELCRHLERALDGTDDFGAERARIRERFFAHPAGTHADHVYRAIRIRTSGRELPASLAYTAEPPSSSD